MSERMVIVIEYEVITGEQVESRDYMQRALTGAMTQIREGADRLDPNHVKVVGIHVGVEDFVDRVLALFAKDASTPSNPPSSPVETTDAPGQRPDHTGVIRPAGDAERLNTYLHAISALSPPGRPDHWVKFSTRLAIADACMAVADAEHAALTAEIARLEANVPNDRCQGCSDEHCTATT